MRAHLCLVLYLSLGLLAAAVHGPWPLVRSIRRFIQSQKAPSPPARSPIELWLNRSVSSVRVTTPYRTGHKPVNTAVWAPLCCTPGIGATNGANATQPRPGFGRWLRGPRGLRNGRAVSGRCVGVQGSGRARLGADLAALPALQTPIFGRNSGTGMGHDASLPQNRCRS